MTIFEYNVLDNLTDLAKRPDAWKKAYGSATLIEVLNARIGSDKINELKDEQSTCRLKITPYGKCKKTAKQPYQKCKTVILHKKDGGAPIVKKICKNGKSITMHSKEERAAKKVAAAKKAAAPKFNKKKKVLEEKPTYKVYYKSNVERYVEVYYGTTCVRFIKQYLNGERWEQ